MAALSLKEFYHKYGTGVPNSWEQVEQIWNAATEYAVENCHSTQQLKAEIASDIDAFCNSSPVDLPKNLDLFIKQLRQRTSV